MPKWIRFEPAPPSPTGKTKVWTVSTADGHHHLGFIRWFSSWRRYNFFPSIGTSFDATCLRDIAALCETETTAHREKKTS